MLHKASLLIGSLLLLGGCTRPFQAASPNQAVPGAPRVAQTGAKGVSMTAQIDAWDGDPSTLNSVLTPVKISLNNESDHPLSLRYQNFKLSNPEGIRSTAIPPFEIRGSANDVAPISPMFSYRGFYPYPSYGFYGPGFGYWTDNWGWNSGWYNSAYGFWQRDLPTADMLRKAIPEGVLNPGGQVSGYLYFQLVPSDTQSLTVETALIDGRSHKQFATLEVPFVRK